MTSLDTALCKATGAEAAKRHDRKRLRLPTRCVEIIRHAQANAKEIFRRISATRRGRSLTRSFGFKALPGSEYWARHRRAAGDRRGQAAPAPPVSEQPVPSNWRRRPDLNR